mmetsp:Transcript_15128/g.44623  ORF Transcript_15128/g.44623 Transcript_15128/m.44623 type:complete len:98 (-) Transcript_15128:1551-1844(-)|eukprot:363118-Chlamydomonas_euryale.AAC.1
MALPQPNEETPTAEPTAADAAAGTAVGLPDTAAADAADGGAPAADAPAPEDPADGDADCHITAEVEPQHKTNWQHRRIAAVCRLPWGRRLQLSKVLW